MILNDICDLIVDCEHKTAPRSSKGYPSVRVMNVGRGRLVLEGINRVDEDTYRKWTRRAVPQPNDLIIAREAPLGNVAIIQHGQQVCLGQRTVLVRPDKEQVDPGFLCYFLLGDYAQDRFHSMSTGATVAHLNMSDIRGLPLPKMPPLSTQQRIAAVLSAYDDLIENNTRRVVILEEMARRLYEEWIVHFRYPGHEGAEFEGNLPKGWNNFSLGDLVEERRDSVQPNAVDVETAYVGLEHIPRRSITLREWSTAATVQSTKLTFCENDILFGKIRPYFHKVSLAPLSGVTSSDTIVLRALSPDHLPLALLCTSSDPFVDHAAQTSNGTKMPRADWKVLKRYQVAVPTSEQLGALNAFVVPLLQNLKLLNRKTANLRAQRDLLLPKLVSGEIDVSEAQRTLEAAA